MKKMSEFKKCPKGHVYEVSCSETSVSEQPPHEKAFLQGDSLKKCNTCEGTNRVPEQVECPYCNGEEIDDTLENLPKKKEIDKDILKQMADCYMTGPNDF